MCIPFQSIPPPTQGTKRAVQMLQLLGVSQFVVGLIKLFVLQQFSGFYDFFTLFILYMAWAQLNYCNCVIAVFYFLQNLLMIFIFFGMNVELDIEFFSPTRFGVTYFIFFFYYLGACYVAFLAYREFKVLQYDQMGGLIQTNQQNDWAQNNNEQQYNQQQAYYNQPAQAQPQQQAQRGGQFQAFQGRGVQIG
ncbi:unnamed protein product [Paramecium sonneborni]|uniref:Transmembrane protein n=1 Tax=Paramecium sonneborni TaxID=65129 RepID=A0A8S1ND91_9CILI|nr:unnamed protein product [Paramecium sonneborni]